MLYKALVSFSGVVSMTMGEVKNIENEAIAKDLLKARYIVKVEDQEKFPSKKKTK